MGPIGHRAVRVPLHDYQAEKGMVVGATEREAELSMAEAESE